MWFKSRRRIVRLYNMSDKKQRIYDDGEIPLFCERCGWTESHRYRLFCVPDAKALIGTQKVSGKCIGCGGDLERVFPLADSEELLRFDQCLRLLKGDGRLVDDRVVLL